MNDRESNAEYLSFLLRMWREPGAAGATDQEDEPTWRASTVSTLTGRRKGFASLEDLFVFLRRQAGAETE